MVGHQQANFACESEQRLLERRRRFRAARHHRRLKGGKRKRGVRCTLPVRISSGQVPGDLAER